MSNLKPRVFSGIQPSGNLHIGNYLGAITQWVEMQGQYDCIFSVVDMHAVTVPQDPRILRQKIIEVAKIYLASGIDPKKSIIFQQSDVSAHAELCWILNTISRMSDLFKMTQFKDKIIIHEKTKHKNKDKINDKVIKTTVVSIDDSRKVLTGSEAELEQMYRAGVGLFDYPVLMTADILLYNTDVVPVGEDQKQHVELARDLAKRFNHLFGETFKIPQVKIRPETARVMGLDDPSKKMSKSALSEYNFIALTDNPDLAAKKIMKAKTDSGTEIIYNPDEKPAIANLISIYSLLAQLPIKTVEKNYHGQGYGEFKKDLAQIVKKFLSDFQEKLSCISDENVKNILQNGASQARPIAEQTLKKTKQMIGFY